MHYVYTPISHGIKTTCLRWATKTALIRQGIDTTVLYRCDFYAKMLQQILLPIERISKI